MKPFLVPRGVDQTSPWAQIRLRLQKWEPSLSCLLLGPKPSSVCLGSLSSPNSSARLRPARWRKGLEGAWRRPDEVVRSPCQLWSYYCRFGSARIAVWGPGRSGESLLQPGLPAVRRLEVLRAAAAAAGASEGRGRCVGAGPAAPPQSAWGGSKARSVQLPPPPAKPHDPQRRCARLSISTSLHVGQNALFL